MKTIQFIVTRSIGYAQPMSTVFAILPEVVTTIEFLKAWFLALCHFASHEGEFYHLHKVLMLRRFLRLMISES